MSKKPSVRPNLGGVLMPQAEAPRREFLYVHVTKEEQEQIQQYCVDNNISVSQFLAELVLKESMKSATKGTDKVLIKAEFELSRDELDKLELLTKFHQKTTIGEYLREILQPHLDLQRLHAPIPRKPLRYYLSEYERHIIMTHIAGKGMAARYYPVMLALKAIAKQQEKQK
jgi:hypothetical protein